MPLLESSNVRRGLAWLRPGWDPRVHRYAECPGCGARHELADAPGHSELRRPFG
ncbi:hypothetical protein [Modestobacter lapidis]